MESHHWSLWRRWNPLGEGRPAFGRPGAVGGDVEMPMSEPTTDLQPRFSGPGATPTPWAVARDALARAEVYWLTTVRPEGRPHVAPLIGVWLDGAFHFCTGEDERKAQNLAANARCAVTTGCNALGAGLDMVVEGVAARVSDEPTLRRIADAYAAKYGAGWRFAVRDGAFMGQGGRALVFAVAPLTAFGFGKGAPFSQTRWRF